MKPFYVGVILMSLVFLLASCRHQSDQNFVVVRVYRDPGSDFRNELDRRLYDFNNFKKQRRVKSGRVIFVATMEEEYQSALGDKISVFRPQLIVLDSPADARLVAGLQVDLQQARSACGKAKNCPAFVPPWVSGEELEATKVLFSAITAD